MTSLMSFGNSNVTSTTFTAVSTFPLLVKVVQQLKPCHALAELLVDRLSVGTPQLLSVGNCQSRTVPARIPRCLRITLLNIRHLHAVLTVPLANIPAKSTLPTAKSMSQINDAVFWEHVLRR